MLRGLYEFRPVNEKTLGFHTNDLLLFLEPHARDKNWLRVANSHGHIGFVPINFIHVFNETTSEGLLGFLDEAIRRARRDHLNTTELLLAVRQNIVTSPYTTEEHVKQIDREINELRGKAISELNYDPSSASASSSNVNVNQSKQRHPSPPRRDQSQSGLQGGKSPGRHVSNSSMMDAAMGIGDGSSAFVPSPTANEIRSRKKKERKQPPPAPPPTAVAPQDDIVQYSQVQHIQPLHLQQQQQQPQLPLLGNPDLVAEYVRSTSSILAGGASGGSGGLTSHYLTGHGSQPNNTELFPNMNLGHAEEQELYCSHECGCGKPRRLSLISNSGGRRCSQDNVHSSNTSHLGAELVDIVRNATGLSHKLSQDATEAVLNFIIETFRHSHNEWDRVGHLLSHLEVTPRAVSQELGVIAGSPDAKTIRTIFNRLTQCKEDEQQRSWALHEDEGMILEYLEKLNKILIDADPSISSFVLDSGQYRSVSELALYYQMETRWSIRAKLVDCFISMATIDDKAGSVLLNSVLPMELAREFRERDKNDGNGDRMCLVANLLVTLLSSGEPIPITHFDYLDAVFLNFVFDTIEKSQSNLDNEKIIDCVMNLLFAYNLQFYGQVHENLIISTLEGRSNANMFTQKAIYFLNRGVDPVNLLPHKKWRLTTSRSIPNSVLKLTTDIFSSKRAADLFYTNDIKVLIDIVTRCVTDLCAGDETRTAYLNLIRMIVRNSNYIEHKHRHDDLVACFSSILQEEEDDDDEGNNTSHSALKSSRDQEIVKEIVMEFPILFGLPPPPP